MYLCIVEQQFHIHFVVFFPTFFLLLNVQKCFMNKNRYKKNNFKQCTSFFLPLYSIKYKYNFFFFVLKYVYIQSK
ncbi:hypothetical protein GDO81_002971 [Engystomops pustulosus]|uniref:Uncharacterized protein n=1 Tax=Engystomops pustulosus TaxID=76066 RepID=A0AAV7DP15_ENGPU|nr:hypothetical protein GDO81_002971 [Engystomops pustulosus]